MTSLAIVGGTVVSPHVETTGVADVVIDDGTIVDVGDTGGAGRRAADHTIDATGCLVIPGLVQAHVHFCQTLFRGLADDLDVVDWLRNWIWPLEQAHDQASMRASAELAILELLLGGTTCALSMETTRHTGASFEAAERMGIRAFIGTAIMDRWEPGTDMHGADTDSVWAEVLELVDRWDGVDRGRLRYALSPRAPVSATDEMWRRCVALAGSRDLILHTHVNENRHQAERVSAEARGRDVERLAELGALNRRLVMAHAVWLTDAERQQLRRHRPAVCHCPSANLKLASGRAPVPSYLSDGIVVAIGADGAACNNRLDAFTEMRLAALVHEPEDGPRAVTARQAFHMATLGGAQALGIDTLVGSIEPGKRADVVVVRRSAPHAIGSATVDPVAQLVYAHTSADVRDVVVDGRVLVRDRQLLVADQAHIVAEAQIQIERLLSRAVLP